MIDCKFIVVCEQEQTVENGVYFRMAVVKNNGKKKACFWFVRLFDGNIYHVNAAFVDRSYSKISLYVALKKNSNNNTCQPAYAYIETNALILTAEKCRDTAAYLLEMGEICDTITEFFTTFS